MFGKYIASFIALLPISLGIDYIVRYFSNMISVFNPEVTSFILVHTLLFPFCRTPRKFLWLSLTLAHGLAHVIHPAFLGTTPNPYYTPLYDFIIHALQCLCAYLIYRNKLAIGLGSLFGIMIATAGYWAHYDNSFMNTYLWIIMSSGGVFGTQMHMMLLQDDHNDKSQLMLENIILWTLPYIGYLIPSWIPQWDNFVNILGLFRVWYFNYFWVKGGRI